MAWERATTPVRDSTAAHTVAALAATEGQPVNLGSVKFGSSPPPASFKINVDVVQRVLPCHVFFSLHAFGGVSGSDEEDFSFSGFLLDSFIGIERVVGHFEPGDKIVARELS